MAFQQPTSEDSPANAHYLLSFDGIAGSPTASSDRDHQGLEPASPLVSPLSDNDIDLLLAGEIFPVSERCLSSPAYLRRASSGGNIGSVILLQSSREYDASHPNLDAHSAPPRTDLVESESAFLFGEFGFVLGMFENVGGLLCGCYAFVVGAHLTTKRSHYVVRNV